MHPEVAAKYGAAVLPELRESLAEHAADDNIAHQIRQTGNPQGFFRQDQQNRQLPFILLALAEQERRIRALEGRV
ncbi:MAG: hypothetical protein ACFB50_09720 [Rubrobacteraceae bacterium]